MRKHFFPLKGDASVWVCDKECIRCTNVSNWDMDFESKFRCRSALSYKIRQIWKNSQRTTNHLFTLCKVHHMRSQESRVKVLTEAGAVPAVVSPGTVRDTAVPQEPHPRSFAPQTDTAGPRLQVDHATLTVWAALWKQGKHANHCKYSKLGFSGLWGESKTDKVFNTNAVQSFCQEKHF